MQLPPPPPIIVAPTADPTTTPPRVRPPFVGIAAMLVWFGASWIALRLLWPYPPRYARDILVPCGAIWGAVAFGLVALTRGRVRGLAAALVVVGALGPFAMTRWAPGVAQPPEHVIPGRPTLAVNAAPDGTWDLYILPSGDASHLATLTDTTSPDELWPQLSPDHTQLAYAVPQPDGSDQVWILRLGADWRVLSRTRIPLDRSATPEAWTPDGRLVVQLGSASAPVLAYVDLLTGRTTRFLSGASTLSFSPDGRRITFARRHGDGGWAIWVADADGSHAHVVADTPGTDEFPFFSPDGGTIAFTSDVSGSQDVWTVPAAGGDLRDITPHTEGSRDVSFGWSPDGHVLFLSDRSHTGGTFLYFMNADGSDVQLALRI